MIKIRKSWKPKTQKVMMRPTVTTIQKTMPSMTTKMIRSIKMHNTQTIKHKITINMKMKIDE